MPDRRFYTDLQHLNPGLTIIEGNMEFDAAGDVSAFDINGVEAITHTGVGEYRIKLQDAYYVLHGCDVAFAGTTDIGRRVQVKTDNVQSKILDIIVFDMSSPSSARDVPNGAIMYICLRLDALASANE